MTVNKLHSLYAKLKPAPGYFLFTRCCFCIPLRTGCFLLGYLSLILNLLVMIFFAISLAVMASLTRSFHYIHMKQTQSGELVPDENSVDKARLHMIVLVAFLIGGLNITSVLLNSFLLIGLHKKRPGHIKVHVIVASIRLLMSTISLIVLRVTRSTAFYWIEIGISAYFTMLYYSYAKQIEWEQKCNEAKSTQDVISDLVFSCPKKLETEKLTEKKCIQVIHNI